MRRVVVVVSLSLAASCARAARAPLGPPPGKAASPAERIEAYQQLRPSGQGANVYASATDPAVMFNADEPLVLANGFTAERGDELLAVLDPDSPAARAARRGERARARRATWIGIGGAIAGAGVVSIFAGDVFAGPCALPDPCDTNRQLATAGVAALIVGAVVAGVAHQHFTHQEEEARTATFTAYDESLRESLGLCVAGLHLIACEDVPPSVVRRRAPDEIAPPGR